MTSSEIIIIVVLLSPFVLLGAVWAIHGIIASAEAKKEAKARQEREEQDRGPNDWRSYHIGGNPPNSKR